MNVYDSGSSSSKAWFFPHLLSKLSSPNLLVRHMIWLKFCLCCFLGVWFGPSYLTFLCPSFLIGQTGITIVQISYIVVWEFFKMHGSLSVILVIIFLLLTGHFLSLPIFSLASFLVHQFSFTSLLRSSPLILPPTTNMNPCNFLQN